jgi:hypothetical protein
MTVEWRFFPIVSPERSPERLAPSRRVRFSGPGLGSVSGAAGVDEALHEVPDVLFHRSERPV